MPNPRPAIASPQMTKRKMRCNCRGLLLGGVAHDEAVLVPPNDLRISCGQRPRLEVSVLNCFGAAGGRQLHALVRPQTDCVYE